MPTAVLELSAPRQAGATAKQPLLRMSGICKRFGGVAALDGVNFDLLPGEVHALLGENGAGKSTLIKILAGIHQPDEGELFVDGRRVQVRDVSHAERLGIRSIHQELSLAPNLSVGDAFERPSAIGKMPPFMASV